MADKEGVELPGDFDALLRETMAVEPSPEFLARVRERVSEERRPSRWMAPSVLAATALAATAAVATLIVALALPALVGSPAVTPNPPVAPVTRVATPALPPPAQPPVQPAAVPPARVAAVRRSAPVVREAPVVVVDQRQRAALGLFVRMAQQGSLPEEILAQTMPTSSQPIEEHVLPIVVEQVTVSPIPVGGVLPSGIERN